MVRRRCTCEMDKRTQPVEAGVSLVAIDDGDDGAINVGRCRDQSACCRSDGVVMIGLCTIN